MKGIANKKADAELRAAANEFMVAFMNAVASSEEEAQRIASRGSFSFFQGGGIVEQSDELLKPLSRFTIRAASLLGAKGGNEKAIRSQAFKVAQNAFLNNTPTTNAALELIEGVFAEGTAGRDDG